MPVATIVTGTPLKVPVKVLIVVDWDDVVMQVPGLSKYRDIFQAQW